MKCKKLFLVDQGKMPFANFILIRLSPLICLKYSTVLNLKCHICQIKSCWYWLWIGKFGDFFFCSFLEITMFIMVIWGKWQKKKSICFWRLNSCVIFIGVVWNNWLFVISASPSSLFLNEKGKLGLWNVIFIWSGVRQHGKFLEKRDLCFIDPIISLPLYFKERNYWVDEM